MEIIAWLTHRYIMHGVFWYFHKDHHTRDNKGFFEKNDFFFLIFALPGSAFIMYGLEIGINFIPFWIGLGITIYGAAYFFVHDLFIHQRIKVLKKTKTLVFISCEIFASEKIVATASGTWKIL